MKNFRFAPALFTALLLTAMLAACNGNKGPQHEGPPTDILAQNNNPCSQPPAQSPDDTTCSSDYPVCMDTVSKWKKDWKNFSNELITCNSGTDDAKWHTNASITDLMSQCPGCNSIRAYFAIDNSEGVPCLVSILGMVDSDCNDNMEGADPYLIRLEGESQMISVDNAQTYIGNYQTFISENEAAFADLYIMDYYTYELSSFTELMATTLDTLDTTWTCDHISLTYALRNMEVVVPSSEKFCTDGGKSSTQRVIDMVLEPVLADPVSGDHKVQRKDNVNFARPCPKFCGCETSIPPKGS